MRPIRRRLLGLVGIAAAVPLVEAAVLVSLEFRGAEGLITQSTSVRPYDSYHDMRWLLVYHNSWLAFVLGLAGVIVLRGALSTALVGLAWPAEVRRPPARALLLRNLAVAAFTAALVGPFAALAVAASVVSLSWFLFASLVPMFLLAPFLQRMAVGRTWWRGLPTAELVGWSLLDFVVISVAGGLVWSPHGALTLLIAVLAGGVNGLLWRQTVRAAVLPSHVRWRRVPVVPVVVVMALAIPVVAQVLARPGPERNSFAPAIFTQPLAEKVPYAVILVAGYDSAYDGGSAVDPAVERFSYAGLDERGRPRPYGPEATHRSLKSSGELLAAQVDGLHRRTGRPIALLGESEGTVVARAHLRDRPESPVRALLMFSPLVRTGRAYYPPPDADTGWGVAAGWLLRAIFGLVNVGPGDTTLDEPFIRSLLEDAPFYRFHTMCPIPGVRVIAFLPTVSGAEAPPGPFTRIPVFETPSFHGGFLSRPMIHDRLIDFLAGEDLSLPRREYGLIQRLGAAWQVPSLTITANREWRSQEPPGPPFGLSSRLCGPLKSG